MERLIFADAQRQYFAESGFSSFSDFFEYDGGEDYGVNTKRAVIRFTAGSEGKAFFMKRFYGPHLKDVFFAWCSFGRLFSQARCEWENVNMLFAGGIETYRPVCYGERCGMKIGSFLVTRELQSRCLTDFVAGKRLSAAEKQKLICCLGKFVRRIHDAKISLPDLYLWHIYVTESKTARNETGYDFAVIDLHRMKHNVTNRNEQLKNLGRLIHSMRKEYFEDDLRRLLIKSYARQNQPGSTDNLIKTVEKYCRRISARRKPKPY